MIIIRYTYRTYLAINFDWCLRGFILENKCERIWEKGLYRAKTKLKLRLGVPLRVNQVKKISFSITKNYPFPIFLPNLKSNLYRQSALTAPFPQETIKKRYWIDKLLASFSTKTLKSLPMKKQYFNAYNFAFLLGKDTLNSLF